MNTLQNIAAINMVNVNELHEPAFKRLRSYVDMEDCTEQVNENKSINISCEEDSDSLEEDVVLDFSKLKQKRIKNDKIEEDHFAPIFGISDIKRTVSTRIARPAVRK